LGRPDAYEAYQFGVFRMSESAFYSGNGTWEPLGFINTAHTWELTNCCPGFVRDQFGHVSPPNF